MSVSELALGQLRAAKAALLDRPDTREILNAKEEVLARYGPNFQPGVIESIEEAVLRSFLYFENNRHWSGLNRQVNRVCSDMAATRRALGQLVDETRPVAERMHPVTDIKGMGKGIITAILHVAYSDKYGVWNNTSHEGLEALGPPPLVEQRRIVARVDALMALCDQLEASLTATAATRRRLLDALLAEALAPTEGREAATVE